MGARRTISLLLITLTAACGNGIIGGPEPSFGIQLELQEGLSPAQNIAFFNAADRWARVIVGGLSNVDTQTTRLPDECRSLVGAGDVVIDDLLIEMSIGPIDGQGGALAEAGPCAVRSTDGSPIIGRVVLDRDDVETLESRGQLELVATHEIGHVLGIGTLWESQGLLRSPSLPDNPGADTRFVGPQAQAAYDTVAGQLSGLDVPVENTAEEGSADSHWREDVFESELMTPFLADDERHAPLSSVTVGSLRDLGFWEVDPAGADDYRLPLPPPTRSLTTAVARPETQGFCHLLSPMHAVP